MICHQKTVASLTFALAALFFDVGSSLYTNEGTSFAIYFPPSFVWSSDGDCQLIFLSRTSTTVNVRSTLGNLNLNLNVTAFNATYLTLDGTHKATNVGVSTKVVYVTAQSHISLFAYDSTPSTGSSGGQRRGFLVFPVSDPSMPENNDDLFYLHSLGSSHTTAEPHSQFTISALENNTDVRVYRRNTGGYYLTVSENIDRGEAICYTTGNNEDYTGAKVNASKPISVTSGHSNLMYTNEGSWRSQTIGSSILPAEQLGNEYLVPGISGGYDNDGTTVRVVSLANGNLVHHDTGPSVVLQEGEFYEYTRATMQMPSLVTCVQKCSVALYTYQQSSTTPRSGTFQLQVLPPSGFSNNLLFSAPQDNQASLLLSIVVDGANHDNIFLDGLLIDSQSWQTVANGSVVYTHTTMPVSGATHNLYTTNPNLRLMGYLYGHFNVDNFRGMSFGYPVGFSSNYLITTTTTMAPTTSQTTPRTTTATPPGDNRNAPWFRITIVGNFTSSNGQPFTQDCNDRYSQAMRDKGVDMVGVVNNHIGALLCPGRAPTDLITSSVTSALTTNNTYGGVRQNYFLSPANHIRYQNVLDCQVHVSDFLQVHSNWGNPIIPNQPGCPGLVWSPAFFVEEDADWYCIPATQQDSNVKQLAVLNHKALVSRSPAYVVHLFGNFTTGTGETLTIPCANAYTNSLELRAFQMMPTLNNRISNNLLCVGYNVTVTTVTTTFTPFGSTGSSRIHYYLTPETNEVPFNHMFFCADEMQAWLSDHNNWGRPLLGQEPGCPALVYTPEMFFPQPQDWYCFAT